MGIEEAVTTLRRRLEMVDTGNNLRNNKKCKKCDEKDTTEHIIECRDSSKELGVKTEWLKETDDIKIIRKVNKWLKKEKGEGRTRKGEKRKGEKRKGVKRKK